MVARQAGAGEKRLDAAAQAAVAGRARHFDGGRARQAVVPPLAGHRVGPGQHVAVHHDAAASTRADDDAEHHACAGRRAASRLGEREAVGIVREPNRPLETRRQVAVKRPAVQPRGVRVLHHTRGRRNGSRHADADTGPVPELALDLAHQACDRLQRAVVVVARRRRAPARGNLAAVRNGGRLDLGSTEVHADAERCLHHAVLHRASCPLDVPTPAFAFGFHLRTSCFGGRVGAAGQGSAPTVPCRRSARTPRACRCR
jgi:hypothetical protein